ncbi:hypothetical protein P7D73_21980 [Enterococcus raffinosus]|uniref:hypothetical protein n=1 Tax=Enterococcus raffinosus TaxID=71452 RepID=UPI00288CB18E|nr:hypothetical protein [Enterococcus raffinosus]MDT2525101.1 hypothetical protein [Enterococcus raffinosus]MDT2593214.1 hypothetical protein [Enterococcus raffinosus]
MDFKNEIKRRISELEQVTYGHDDNAEEMTEQILHIVEASKINEEEMKRTIANEVIRLLENFRFETV